MKVALAHDYLNQYGGAERVLEVLAEMFPEAPIYTLLYDETATLGKFSAKGGSASGGKREIITSFLDKPAVRKNHRPFIPLMPLAMRFLKVAPDFDLVISSSASFAKGIHCGPHTQHLAYIHTPLRYAWESDYLPPETTKLMRILYKPLLSYLRRWDYKAAQKPGVLIANSQFIANKIEKYYKRDALVVYPPVDLSVFYPWASPHVKDLGFGESGVQAPNKGSHFLAIGRFLHYKKFDLIIDAFSELGLPLKIVGQGPEEEKLKKLAEDKSYGYSDGRIRIAEAKGEGAQFGCIEFMPFVKSDSELRALYQNARAVIFPQVEDFGLVAAESVACGTPVIAYNAGGAREIVNVHSGVLFPQPTKKFLIRAVNNFIEKEADFKPEIVSEQSAKFSKENFVKEIRKIIERYFAPH